MNKNKKILVDELMKKFCKDRYGFEAEYRFLKLKHCEDYVLTEYGHLYRFKGKNPKGYCVKGMKDKGRLSQSGKRWKNGFVIDQFYKKNKEGLSERFMTISRAKLMLMTFSGITLSKARKMTIFPIDGNNKNLHHSNLKAFENSMTGIVEIYGLPQQGLLSKNDVKKIRRSALTNSALAIYFNRSRHTISRIRNLRTYKQIN
jgi:hypothetical protein